jgi:hypothetical protein
LDLNQRTSQCLVGQRFFYLPCSCFDSDTLPDIAIIYLRSTVASDATQQRTANGSGSGTFARISGNGTDDGTLCGSRYKITTGGRAFPRFPGHAAKQGTAHSACCRTFTRIAGNGTDDGTLCSPTEGILCELATVCRSAKQHSCQQCTRYWYFSLHHYSPVKSRLA